MLGVSARRLTTFILFDPSSAVRIRVTAARVALRLPPGPEPPVAAGGHRHREARLHRRAGARLQHQAPGSVAGDRPQRHALGGLEAAPRVEPGHGRGNLAGVGPGVAPEAAAVRQRHAGDHAPTGVIGAEHGGPDVAAQREEILAAGEA